MRWFGWTAIAVFIACETVVFGLPRALTPVQILIDFLPLHVMSLGFVALSIALARVSRLVEIDDD
jgi:hypothetical protein